jgi:putative nucleotidyltransferase with HDIG domain
MVKFIMMIGLQGSGKSTLAKQIAEYAPVIILSSDIYRQKEYGDESRQGDNSKIFDKIHSDILSLLASGKSVILDSTNISAKYRVALLQKINKLYVKKIAIVVATEFQKCLRQNEMRERVVPLHVISRYRKQFQMPQYNEGWDEISIVYNYNPDNYSWNDLWKKMDVFNQNNPHHSKTLGEHTRSVYREVLDYGNERIKRAAILHDIGKLYTKTFEDSKGNPSDIAHFYSHESVSAYEAMFYLDVENVPMNDIIWICGIIQNHMRPYGIQSEKSRLKFLELVGQDMYNDVFLLNVADKKSKS